MKEYKIITLGGAGEQICNTLWLKGIEAKCLAHFGTNPWQSEWLNINDKFLVRKGMLGVESTDYEVMDEVFEAHLSTFEKVIEPNVFYLVVCGLGGRTGAGLAINLSKLLVLHGKEFSVLATTPCRFEGKQRMCNALRALEKLKSLAGNQQVFIQLEELMTSDFWFFMPHQTIPIKMG